jgi:mono/diheme cytochrome c family protein
MKITTSLGVGAALACAAAASITFAQPAQPGPPPGGGPPPPGTPRPVVYPPRAVDPQGVERGRVLYTQNGCATCHGPDTRGGTGPALHRRAAVLNDVRGEKLGPLLAAGLPTVPNHVFKFEQPQVVDIADFLHSQRATGTGNANVIRRVPSILTGQAEPGKAYFDKTCGGCHSATGDLAKIATRITDPRALQQRWLAPPPTKPITATVGLPGGAVTGDVVAISEFEITLKTPAGERVIPRDGPRPRVVLTNPLAAHKALLRRITDTDIHNVTAYLVTLK